MKGVIRVGGTSGKNPPTNAGDIRDEGLIPVLGRSPGEANGNPLHYSCLGNPMDRGAWQVMVRVAKSQTPPKRLSTHTSVLHDGIGALQRE